MCSFGILIKQKSVIFNSQNHFKSRAVFFGLKVNESVIMIFYTLISCNKQISDNYQSTNELHLTLSNYGPPTQSIIYSFDC